VLFLNALTKSFVFFIVVLFLSPVLSAGAWWNNGWEYRKPVMIIDTSGSDLADYPVLVEFDSASLVSSGVMGGDCGDLRFVDFFGLSELSYWVESGCNTSSTKVWVKVPSIPANDSTDIYMYYGNPLVASASDEVGVFYIANRNFDISPAGHGWSYYDGGGQVYSLTSTNYHSAPYSAFLQHGGCGEGYIYQDVVVPLTSGAVYLKFWDSYYMNTWASAIGIKIDDVWVKSYPRGSSRGWAQQSIDISAYKGETVTLKIYHRDTSQPWCNYGDHSAYIRVDDFQIHQQASSEPTISLGVQEQGDTPAITNVSVDPLLSEAGQSVTVVATATDPQGIETIESYSFTVKRPNGSVFEGPVTQASNEYVCSPDEVGYWTVEATATDVDDHTSELFVGTFGISDWWNTGWNYRKPVTITDTSGSDLADYPVLVEFDSASLISAGVMKNDCADLRFADVSGTQELSYWVEPGCNTANTKVWVKVPSIPASGSVDIHMYYGNLGVNSASDSDATFEFFDDFETMNWSKWSQFDGSGTSVSNGVVTAYNNGIQTQTRSRKT